MGKPLTPGVRPAPLDDARRAIAALMIARRGPAEASVGDVRLWEHQRDAVSRLRDAIAEFGGALLADDVGTGKTFVALAVASRHACPLVVAPAALRGSWRAAAERAGRSLPFVSFESLSRGRCPPSAHDIVIVDEAHHARNPLAKRYGALARLVAGIPVLLLTATPIHNDRDDLVALLALFLGASAAALDDAALARCVVRRGREVFDGGARVPVVRGPIALAHDADDDATPDAILALPPPIPAADAGTAGALVTTTLLRQWASSQGALLAAIRRRLATAHALASTLGSGRYPTRAELSAWTLGDDAQQLVMSELLAPAGGGTASGELRAAVGAHIDGLRALRRVAAADPDIDRRR
ncbi:MAG TPA: SNF2-related protein, partial [Gemmatimonadaceae bacterium]|nr:SNF2-related protein [Gemmatimonadaceae bacterium]